MGKTILVADDEDCIVEVVATILEGEGYRVLRAHDGATALDLIGRERPDPLIWRKREGRPASLPFAVRCSGERPGWLRRGALP
jgi:DNA-binding NtrC family response regulator